MGRSQFPEFAQLPSDLQTIIFDYVLDRRDPYGINVPDREDFADIHKYIILKRKRDLQHWIKLRLVCKEWSQWFSVGAIRYFIGNLDKLASNQLLEGMTGLVSLEIYRLPDAPKLEPEAFECLASMIPPSVRYLNSCSVELLKSLPETKASALQTVIFSCDGSEPQLHQSLDTIFDLFGKRVKHLRLSYNMRLMRIPQILFLARTISNCPAEEMTLSPKGGRPEMRRILMYPSKLKRLNILNLPELPVNWIDRAAGNLEVLNAPNSTLKIHHRMPVFQTLKEISVCEICPFADDEDDDDFNLDRDEEEDDSDRLYDDETLLRSFWPKLEKLQLNRPGDFLLPPGLSNLNSLRSLRIFDQFSWDNSVDLSKLPSSLEDLEYFCEHFGEIEGQPPQELKNLRKLKLWINSFHLPKGVFNRMPAIQELCLHSCQGSEYKGIKLEELLPLRHSLVDLDVEVCPSNNSQDVLYQFSCLKRIQISRWGEKPCELGSLPQSLEKLELHGNFIEGEPTKELPNLKVFDVSGYRGFPVQLTICILLNAPKLRTAYLKLEFDGKTEEFLEGMKGQTLKRLARLELAAKLEPLTEKVFQLLEICPNIENLHVQKDRLLH